MFKEFKEFALRGNVMDMAVGVIIGAAFGKVVSSAVQDLLMPPIGLLAGNVDFSNLFVTLKSGATFPTLQAAKDAGVPTLNYGIFLNHVVDFTIVAFVVFLMIRQVNRFTRKQEAAAPPPPATRECPECCSSIPARARRCAHCTASVPA